MIHNVEDFEVTAIWPEGVAPGEQDVAHIRIMVDGHVITRVADSEKGVTRSEIYGSGVTLGLFLVDHWWRLRYEPYPETLLPSTEWRFRHELTAMSGGTRWPPVMIYGTGSRVFFAPRAGTADIPGPIRYPELVVASVQGGLYERKVDAFFELVLNACAGANDVEALAALVASLSVERKDREVADWRRLEAQLGFDPDMAPAALMEILAKFEDRLGESAVGEAAVSAPGIESAEVLRCALEAAEGSEIRLDRRVAYEAVANVASVSEPPWRTAERAARIVRERVGMPHGPIKGTALGEIFSEKWEILRDAQATASQLPYGAVMSVDDNRDHFALQSLPRMSARRRFELTRALGDAAWDAHATFAPVSHAKTDRQKFQRAFAQSFLCPFEDLIAYLNTDTPSEDDIHIAARHFHVTDGVVRTVLVNKQVLPRERLVDRLEAA